MITKTDLEKLRSKDPKIKYGFAKELLKIGAGTPDSLYEHFAYWDELTTSDNNVLKWTAIDIIGYLSAIDEEHKVDNKIDDLLKLLHSGVLITCNHAIFALGLIAQNRPEFKKTIINELIAISNDEFGIDECKNIATGKVLEAFKPFISEIKNNVSVVEFIENATNSTRNSTKKKAVQLLKKIYATTN